MLMLSKLSLLFLKAQKCITCRGRGDCNSQSPADLSYPLFFFFSFFLGGGVGVGGAGGVEMVKIFILRFCYKGFKFCYKRK